MSRNWHFIPFFFQTQTNSTEDTDKEDTVNCQVWDLNIGKEENQLLNFEKHISEKEVSFFNPKLEISMISLKDLVILFDYFSSNLLPPVCMSVSNNFTF